MTTSPPALRRGETWLEPIGDLLADPAIRVVGWPGRRLDQPLLPGDVAIRQSLGAPRRSYILTAAPALSGPAEAEVFALESGRATKLTLCGPDRLLLGDLTIVRPLGATEAVEFAESAGDRPTIRTGSRGPAVIDAQQRLNGVHANRLAAATPGLADCPLAVDGIFGPHTRNATVSFQRLAFPTQPNEWDGIIGPHTWTALLAAEPGPPPPPPPPPPPQPTATIEFVLDHDDDRVVDAASPVATALMFGLWNDAYNGGNIRNGASPADSFVDRDRRRFYLRVTDPGATAATLTASWRTVKNGGGNEDAPADQTVTLTRAAKGVYVSRALILVTNEVDLALQVHSGLGAGLRKRGQSDFRLRRATLASSVVADYAPASGAPATVKLPVFQRSPDLRRRLKLGIVHYGIVPDKAITTYINAQIERARLRWMQTGLHIERGKAIDRAIVASARDAAGNYIGTRLSQEEADACNDLMKVIDDKTVTVCFARFPKARPIGVDPFNAYATRQFSPKMDLKERFFVFINLDLDINDDTLAHELHHVIHNRGDAASLDQFFTFNTRAPNAMRRVIDKTITLPDSRIYHRVHVEHGNPDADPKVECTANWMRRRRKRRYNPPDNSHPRGFSPADDSTGNILTEAL